MASQSVQEVEFASEGLENISLETARGGCQVLPTSHLKCVFVDFGGGGGGEEWCVRSGGPAPAETTFRET